MVKKFLFIFLIFFTALLQVSFLGVFTGGGPLPNLLLMAVLILAYLRREKEAYLFAFLGGFFLDLLNIAQVAGVPSLSLVLALLFWQVLKKITTPRRPTFLLYVFMTSFFIRAAFAYPWSYPWGLPSLFAAGGDVLLAALFLPLLTILSRYLFDEDYWQLDFRDKI